MAEAYQLGVGPRVAEQLRTGKIVVKHEVDRGQALGSAHGEQTGVAWTGSHEIDFAETIFAAICWHNISYGNSNRCAAKAEC
jgi:hypothetical protein